MELLVGILISLGVGLLYLVIAKSIYTKTHYLKPDEALYLVIKRINELLEKGMNPEDIIIKLSYNYGSKLFEKHKGNVMLVKGVRVILDEFLPADYGLVVKTNERVRVVRVRIQINISKNIKGTELENSLRFIAHNLESIVRDCKKSWNNKPIKYDGTMMVRTNILAHIKNNVLYVNVKEWLDE